MQIADIKPILERSAWQVARAYGDWVSLSDAQAHLWLFVVANEPRLAEYMSRENGERILTVILQQEARTWAIKERATVSGYSPEDLTWYSLAQIRDLLPDVYDYEGWQSSGGSATERSSKPIANATGDRLASIIDVSMALKKLPGQHQDILACHFQDGNDFEFIARVYDSTSEAIRKRIERMLKAIQGHLGGARPTDPYEAINGQFDTRSKGRKAVSNAAARAATDNAWDGS